MSHGSSQFWLSLPAPENSQCFAIGFIGSKTRLSAQCEAHYNFPKLAVPQAVCPVAAPHRWTLAPYPGAHLDQFYLLS